MEFVQDNVVSIYDAEKEMLTLTQVGMSDEDFINHINFMIYKILKDTSVTKLVFIRNNQQ